MLNIFFTFSYSFHRSYNIHISYNFHHPRWDFAINIVTSNNKHQVSQRRYQRIALRRRGPNKARETSASENRAKQIAAGITVSANRRNLIKQRQGAKTLRVDDKPSRRRIKRPAGRTHITACLLAGHLHRSAGAIHPVVVDVCRAINRMQISSSASERPASSVVLVAARRIDQASRN